MEKPPCPARKLVPQVTSATPKQINRKRQLVFVASGLAVIGVCVLLRSLMGSNAAHAQIPNPFRKRQPQQQAAQPAGKTAGKQDGGELPKVRKPQHDVMAVVNGQDIHRDALATACCRALRQRSARRPRQQAAHHALTARIAISKSPTPEVDAEIDRMAKRFKIGKEQWLQMLERERGINAEQYKRDILWPTLALRKCAANQTCRETMRSSRGLRCPIRPGR